VLHLSEPAVARPASPSVAGPATAAAEAPARAFRYLVPLLAAFPIVLTGGLHAGLLAGLVFLVAAAVDARRPAAIATLPFARFALTATTVALATLAGAVVALAAWGSVEALPFVVAGAVNAVVGLTLANALEDKHAVTRILVLGTPAEARDLSRTIAEVGARRFAVVATTDALPELDRLQAESGAHLVVHTDHVARPAVLGHIAASMRHRRVRAMPLDHFCEQALGVVPLSSVDAAWLAEVADPTLHARDARIARVVDVVLSIVLLVPVLPLIAVLAPFILMDREGSVFFRQPRVGRGGRPFSILKLRTMRGTGSDWATKNDPRVTRLGAVLRKTHIDELPQILNVLRGDMALVGPRPEQVAIADGLEMQIPLFPYRHMVRPGITGWARVRCGYASTAEESALKLGNDLFYIKHRSIVLDLAVMLETLRLTLFEKQYEVRAPAAKYILGPKREVRSDEFPLDAPVPIHAVAA
jgi:lipopolysaccharide/colanic/teichoic acid biosynthesis glycosyltransferase